MAGSPLTPARNEPKVILDTGSVRLERVSGTEARLTVGEDVFILAARGEWCDQLWLKIAKGEVK
jgi:hypothetical protein